MTVATRERGTKLAVSAEQRRWRRYWDRQSCGYDRFARGIVERLAARVPHPPS